MNGTPYGGVATNEDADDGIGYLRVTFPESGERETLCTVARVGTGEAITAAHCIDDATRWEAWIGFGSAMDSIPMNCIARSSKLHPVTGLSSHPTRDVALLDFEDSGGVILPIAKEVPADGSSVLVAGFGLTEQNEIGSKRFAQSTLIRGYDSRLVVDSDGKGGACVGDSGGPLLVGDPMQGYTLVGVLSEGSLSCRAQDDYVSLVPLREWIQSVTLH